jgi:hypothetical protein
MSADNLGAAVQQVATQIAHAQDLVNAMPKTTGSIADGLFNATKNGATCLDDIQIQTSELQRYAGTAFLADSLVGVGEGMYRAVAAFTSEPSRAKEGSAEIMRMVGSASQLLMFAGRYGGPIGLIVNQLLSFITQFMIPAAGEEMTLARQLETELREAAGESTANALGGVLDAAELIGADLAATKFNTMTWDVVRDVGQFESGAEVVWLGSAKEWLSRTENQRTDAWPMVFEAYVLAASQYLQNFLMGLNALKKLDDTGLPSADMGRALAVLDTIRRQHTDFVETVAPVALNKGTVWHVGDNERLYSKKEVVGDITPDYLGGESVQVVVSPGERIWTRNSAGRVWTGYDKAGAWKEVPETVMSHASDLWVVPQSATRTAEMNKALATTARSPLDVYWIVNQQLHWTYWDEGQEEDVRTPTGWMKFGATKTLFDGPAKCVRATRDGTVYTMNPAGAVVSVGTMASSTPASPKLSLIGIELVNRDQRLSGIAANHEKLFIYAGNRIWWKLHKDVRAVGGWSEIMGPVSNNRFVMPAQWNYHELFACNDGSLVAIIDKKVYSWYDAKWRKNENEDATSLFKAPVSGWEMFGCLKSLIAAVAKGADVPMPLFPLIPASHSSGK